jgi:hypothetical protein
VREEAKRIEEIKADVGVGLSISHADACYVIKRVGELEQSNEKLQGMVERAEKGQFNWMNRYHEEKGEPFLEYIDGERPG